MPQTPGTRMHGHVELDRGTASGAPAVFVPVTTNTITLTNDQTVAYINPAGTIAALTIKLPPAPLNGQIASISFAQIVTTLTVQDAAAAAVETAAGAVAVANEYRYVNSTIGWVRWR